MGIEVNNLCFSYGNNLILKNVTTNFKSGKITIIAGPNGSGKTTLVKLFTGVNSPQKNIIKINGVDITSLSVKERSKLVGYVSQQNFTDFDFTVEEIVEMGRYPYKDSWNRESDRLIVTKALIMTDTFTLKNRMISTLSGGELQRVILARALAVEPRFLVLDEPASNLDILHNKEMMDLLTNLTKDLNLTTIIVLHDLDTILKYGNEIRFFKNGVLKIAGDINSCFTPENIYEIYGVRSELITDSLGQKHIVIIK
ncbi:MAG: ABC transporter ATP-binding protein [Spirochaetales bacterium]|nr:ABC transporter ATP-binding protein [Spirochaetales bacterium]